MDFVWRKLTLVTLGNFFTEDFSQCATQRNFFRFASDVVFQIKYWAILSVLLYELILSFEFVEARKPLSATVLKKDQ